MTRHYPLWKVFWLACVPVSVLHQLGWAAYFNLSDTSGWSGGDWHQVVSVKLASEVVMYGGMLAAVALTADTASPRWRLTTLFLLGLLCLASLYALVEMRF